MASFAERLKTRVPNWQRFFERVREDPRNAAYDLLPVLELGQRNAFSKTLAAFSPKTPGFKLTEAQAALHDQLRRDGLTGLQPPLPVGVLSDLVSYFKATPCHDPYRPHLGLFDWDQPPSDEINIGYYTWEEVLRAPHIVALMNNPDILAVAEAYLGCKPVIDNIGVAWAYPGRDTAKGVQRFHRDYDCSRCFKAFYYLSDIDAASGPHTYVKGSHQDRRLECGKAQSDDAIIVTFGAEAIAILTGPAGSWFLDVVYGFH